MLDSIQLILDDIHYLLYIKWPCNRLTLVPAFNNEKGKKNVEFYFDLLYPCLLVQVYKFLLPVVPRTVSPEKSINNLIYKS